jgi:hypothetical protein
MPSSNTALFSLPPLALPFSSISLVMIFSASSKSLESCGIYLIACVIELIVYTALPLSSLSSKSIFSR